MDQAAFQFAAVRLRHVPDHSDDDDSLADFDMSGSARFCECACDRWNAVLSRQSGTQAHTACKQSRALAGLPNADCTPVGRAHEDVAGHARQLTQWDAVAVDDAHLAGGASDCEVQYLHSQGVHKSEEVGPSCLKGWPHGVPVSGYDHITDSQRH